jgi:hypothetical protein
MSRGILTWQIMGEDLVGTYHMPATIPTNGYINEPRVGVLLLNPGPAPRAGNSDLYVHIGDRLASRGIPAFRFDLPGLGDSSGSTPSEIDSYWQEVLLGRNDAATLSLVGKLKQQFGLSSIIVGGLCAAIVPTLNVAYRCPGAIAGNILLEPIFSVGEDDISNSRQTGIASNIIIRTRAKLRRVLSIRDWFIFLTGDNRVAMALRPLRPILVQIQLWVIGHTLPRDMNVPLFMHWKGCLARGIPSLVVVAKGMGNDRYIAHAMDSLPSNVRGKITLIRIPQTNHTLTSGQARDISLDAIEQWMTELSV